MEELTSKIREQEVLLKIPETGDGFDVNLVPYADGMSVRTWFQEGEAGDYRIHVKLKAKKDVPECFIFAGRKALVWKGALTAGELFENEFVTNLSKIIPRYYETPMVMKYVCLSIAAKNHEDMEVVGIEAVRIVDNSLKHLWLCGDSTVTDQSSELPYHPGACYSAWGQMLPAFMAGGFAVSNHAHCGLTTETFKKEGHYKIITEFVRPGDFVLFQFGHNDQKLTHLMADTGYRDNLVTYIQEIRSFQAYPVLITPLARNTWKKDGSYNDLLKEYADMVIALGDEYQVPVLDLHKYSMELICNSGFEASKCWFHPGDMTHTNDYGAYKMAGFIAAELKRVGLAQQYSMLKDGMEENWQPPVALWDTLKSGINNRQVTAQQKEQFDNLEKSADNLIKIIELAKSKR